MTNTIKALIWIGATAGVAAVSYVASKVIDKIADNKEEELSMTIIDSETEEVVELDETEKENIENRVERLRFVSGVLKTFAMEKVLYFDGMMIAGVIACCGHPIRGYAFSLISIFASAMAHFKATFEFADAARSAKTRAGHTALTIAEIVEAVIYVVLGTVFAGTIFAIFKTGISAALA